MKPNLYASLHDEILPWYFMLLMIWYAGRANLDTETRRIENTRHCGRRLYRRVGGVGKKHCQLHASFIALYSAFSRLPGLWWRLCLAIYLTRLRIIIRYLSALTSCRGCGRYCHATTALIRHAFIIWYLIRLKEASANSMPQQFV